MSYKRARKILHSNGIEYVRIQHDKKQIVVNQVITLYICVCECIDWKASTKEEQSREQGHDSKVKDMSTQHSHKYHIAQQTNWYWLLTMTKRCGKLEKFSPYKLFIRGQFPL